MADCRRRDQLRNCFESPAPSASPLSMVAFSLAFVLFLLVLSALPASAPSPSGSSITAAAAAATTAAVAGADAAAMSARSVAIGALNGRGYPRVLAASPDSKLVGIHTSAEKRSSFMSSSGNPVNSASKSPSNAPNFFKPRNVEENFAENPPPEPPLPTAASAARSRETISLLYTELLKRARPSPPLPPLAVPRPGSTKKSPKLGSRLISVMIRASPPPKRKTPSPPKKTANHSPKVPTKSPASASNTSPPKRGVSPPKRGTSPPKKRSPILPKKRPPPPHSSSPPKQKSPKQPPPAKRSPSKRSPPKPSPPKSPPPASPPRRRKPSSAQKSPPPPPPSPPTGSGGVDLGNAQKVLKMLQPYFDDPQFMMFAINGGLLTLMGKALNSTEKVTFFVPDPDTIKDLPDDSPLINDPAIATAVVNFHVVRGRQVTYTELTQAATGTMYMTDQHEPLVKDAASFLFNVVLRPSQGPSRATITMPNAYTDESMQVHVLDSLLIPDSVYFAPPTTSPTISSRPNPPPNPPPRPPQPSPSATPTPPSTPSAPPIASPPPPAVAADKQIPAVATATSPLSSSDPNTTVPAPPAQ